MRVAGLLAILLLSSRAHCAAPDHFVELWHLAGAQRGAFDLVTPSAQTLPQAFTGQGSYELRTLGLEDRASGQVLYEAVYAVGSGPGQDHLLYEPLLQYPAALARESEYARERKFEAEGQRDFFNGDQVARAFSGSKGTWIVLDVSDCGGREISGWTCWPRHLASHTSPGGVR